MGVTRVQRRVRRVSRPARRAGGAPVRGPSSQRRRAATVWMTTATARWTMVARRCSRLVGCRSFGGTGVLGRDCVTIGKKGRFPEVDIVPEEGALCANGKDDDCDGKVDGADEACTDVCQVGQSRPCVLEKPVGIHGRRLWWWMGKTTCTRQEPGRGREILEGSSLRRWGRWTCFC